MGQLPLVNCSRQWGRNAIIWWPFPHSFKNIGQLTFLAGGAGAILRALKHFVVELRRRVDEIRPQLFHQARDQFEKILA